MRVTDPGTQRPCSDLHQARDVDAVAVSLLQDRCAPPLCHEVNEDVLQTAPHVRHVNEERYVRRQVARRSGTTTLSPKRLGSSR